MPDHFPRERLHSFFIEGPCGALEAQSAFPQELQYKMVAVLCHPHPMQQGTMQNKVITMTAKAYELLGIPTVRFNFRGVGKSAGSFANAVGEVDDALDVVRWVKDVLPDFQIAVAGFSFGAYIAARVASTVANIHHLISISPAVDRYDFATCTNIHCPWLLVMGDQDEVVDPEIVWNFAKNPPAPLTLVKLEDVGHFYHGKLLDLRGVLVEWVGERFNRGCAALR